MACSTLAVRQKLPYRHVSVLTTRPRVNVGCPGDYNQWKALGNEGWGYEDLEPYFVKSEKTHSHAASTCRGTKGTLQGPDLVRPMLIIVCA